jgi:hypothetical protein
MLVFQAWKSQLALPAPSPFKSLRRQLGFGTTGKKGIMAQVVSLWVGEIQDRGYWSRHLHRAKAVEGH